MAASGKFKLKDHPNLNWAWANMKRRCNNPTGKNSCYVGITYSSNWNTFDGFCKDMAESYRPGLTLDRIDPNKGYSKDNCRWATPTEQANNKRNNHRVTIDTLTKTLEEWIKTSGLKSSTVRQRIFAYGWSEKDALQTPLLYNKKERIAS